MKLSRQSISHTHRPPRGGDADLFPYVRLAKALVRILPFTLALGLVLSLAAAAIANSRPDPERLIWPLALCIPALMSLTGGWLTFRVCRRACLVCGLAYGASLVIVCCFLSYLLPTDGEANLSVGLRWALRGGMIAFAVIGALLASYAPRKRRKKRKR